MGDPVLRAVVVTGSRKWDDWDAIHDVLAAIEPYMVIHGGAKGADEIAADVALGEYGDLPMPAQWTRDGRAAGPLRNGEMVRVAKALRACGWLVTCEAFPLPGSRGTMDCMKQMAAAGFDVNDHGSLAVPGTEGKP